MAGSWFPTSVLKIVAAELKNLSAKETTTSPWMIAIASTLSPWLHVTLKVVPFLTPTPGRLEAGGFAPSLAEVDLEAEV